MIELGHVIVLVIQLGRTFSLELGLVFLSTIELNSKQCIKKVGSFEQISFFHLQFSFLSLSNKEYGNLTVMEKEGHVSYD